MTHAEFAIELRGIRKRFGDTIALHDASLAVRSGSVHMLLGENGAGKTTCLQVCEGFRAPDTGSATVLGREGPDRSFDAGAALFDAQAEAQSRRFIEGCGGQSPERDGHGH